jgi:hypothetical protein
MVLQMFIAISLVPLKMDCLFSGRNLELIRCTKKAIFDAHFSAFPEPDLILTSVLENFIVDMCLYGQDDEVQLFAHQQITAHVESLFDCVARYPRLNMIILPPLFRSHTAWFSTYLPDLHQFLISEVAHFQSPCLTLCHPFIVLPSLLEDNGVHLVTAGGGRFLAHIDRQLSIILIPLAPMATQPGLTANGDCLDQILDIVSHTSTHHDSLQPFGDDVACLTWKTTYFKVYVCCQFHDDDFIFP